MTDDVAERAFTYEDLVEALAAGYQGVTIERIIRDLGGGAGDYTVYWPKDSIRVIDGSSYEVARAVYCLLRDERTRWMGAPTSSIPAVIARIRRDLAPGGGFAGLTQAQNSRVYVTDRHLPADISTLPDDPYTIHFNRTGHRSEFDFSSLPEY
ncbi:hypothetical protein [Microbacterium sp.]|uniref:hypothetical protein n=1 Tax=Microbacterium sp. TaxID=51671 RepID=UPI003F6F154E